ncbi:SRPBCC family protein [Acidithiobacillus caldus]
MRIVVHPVAGRFDVHADFPIAVSPAQAFAVMTDYDRMANFIPQISKSQVLWRAGERESVLQEGSINLLWFSIPVYVVMSVHLISDQAVRFRSTGGSMVIHGEAQVHPIPGGTVVDYQAILKPKMPVPTSLAESLVTGYIRNEMEALRSEMLRTK